MAAILNIPKQVLINVYKFLDFNSIENSMLVCKCLNNVLSFESLWIFLVKRDLTENSLAEGESYKLFYLYGMPFLSSLESSVDNLRKMEAFSDKEWSENSDADKDEYYSYAIDSENRFEILHEAARLGYEKSIKFILDNLDLTVDSNNYEIGTTALCMAAQHNKILCVEKLLSLGSDLENVDEFGATPLCYAVIGGSLDSVKFLLNKGANVIRVHDTELEMLNDLEECEPKTKKEIMALLLEKMNEMDPLKNISENSKTLKELKESLVMYEKKYQLKANENPAPQEIHLKKLEQEVFGQVEKNSINIKRGDQYGKS